MKIKNLLTAASVFCAIIASAATPSYTTDPAAGNVESLKQVNITFTDAETVTLGTLGYGNAPKVVKEGLDPTVSSNCTFSFKPTVDGKTLSCPLTKEITAEGTYNFYLTKGLVSLDGNAIDEDIIIKYTVGKVAEPEKSWTVTPAEGTVTTIQEITFTFDGIETLALGTLGYGNAPRLVKEGLDPTISSNCNFCFKPTVDGKTLTCKLAKEEAKPGTYKFYLYGSVVKINDEQMAEDIIVTYTIPKPEYKLTANEEGTLDKIETLTFGIDVNSPVTITDSSAKLQLTDTFSEKKYEGTASVVDNALTVTFNPAVTTPAPYSLTIPEGFFAVDGDASNRDWTFEYRIAGTGDFTYTIDPAEGTYEELKSFTITFAGAPLSAGSIADVNNPKLLDSNGSMVSISMQASFQGQTLSLSMSNPFTTEGEYTLVIPNGLIKLNGENPEKDLKFKYTVKKPEPKVDYWTVTPAEGEIAAIEEITFTFTDAETLALGTIGYGNAPRLVKEGLDPTSSANCNFCFKPTVDGNKLICKLQRVEDKPGTYHFYLQDGVLLMDGYPLNEDIVLTYVIPVPEYKLLSDDMSEMDEISTLTFSIDTQSSMTLTDADATLKLVNTFSKEEYEGTAAVENNKLVVTFTPAITAPAPYSVTIPAGFFAVDGDASNRDWTFEYRIVGLGDYSYTIVPAEGTYDELKAFTITFEGSPLGAGSVAAANEPKLLNADGTSTLVSVQGSIEGQNLNLLIPQGFYKKGDYILVIPNGLIKLNGENPESDLKFYYTVDPNAGGVTLTPDEATAEYFNLQGVRVADPKGVVLKKVNGKVEKVVVK